MAKEKTLKKNKLKTDKTKKLTGYNYSAQIKISRINKRITIKKYSGPGISRLNEKLLAISQKHDLTKIWVKAKKEDTKKFTRIGYKKEAEIEKFYDGDDAHILSYFPDENRSQGNNKNQEEEILTKIRNLPKDRNNLSENTLDNQLSFRLAKTKDLPELAQHFNLVFETYPQPINDPNYLQKKHKENVIYGIITDTSKSEIVAAASAETEPKLKNAEMTDFATLPDYRGKGLAALLLQKLENKLKQQNYLSVYTIARAKIFGINKIFQQADYKYTGTLIQNCEIAGNLENMNVWNKTLN